MPQFKRLEDTCLVNDTFLSIPRDSSLFNFTQDFQNNYSMSLGFSTDEITIKYNNNSDLKKTEKVALLSLI